MFIISGLLPLQTANMSLTPLPIFDPSVPIATQCSIVEKMYLVLKNSGCVSSQPGIDP